MTFVPWHDCEYDGCAKGALWPWHVCAAHRADLAWQQELERRQARQRARKLEPPS